MYVCLSLSLSLYLYISLSISLSLYLSISLSISVYLSISLSISFSLNLITLDLPLDHFTPPEIFLMTPSTPKIVSLSEFFPPIIFSRHVPKPSDKGLTKKKKRKKNLGSCFIRLNMAIILLSYPSRNFGNILLSPFCSHFCYSLSFYMEVSVMIKK